MTKNSDQPDQIVRFLRKRDYRLIRKLGEGACGQTVLLHDEQIDKHFVCKKYSPYSESRRQELFAGFLREIKLLHEVHHHNVVRLFSYFVYPDQLSGYILMEYVDGSEVDDFLSKTPEQLTEVFLQSVAGFSYLERVGILHRDIRPGNLMVRSDGIVKIIDLGFGKRVSSSEDFDKSISLNWWCDPPNEFSEQRYDFRTEVYFVGKLFERIVQRLERTNFKYMEVLRRMCLADPNQRAQSFTEIERTIRSDQFAETEFTTGELALYRTFAQQLCKRIAKIESSAKYESDIALVISQLGAAHRAFMLEETVPNAATVINCFVLGTYHYTRTGMPVPAVRDFLQLLKSLPEEKARIVLGNLHTKLNALPHYTKNPFAGDDEIPF